MAQNFWGVFRGTNFVVGGPCSDSHRVIKDFVGTPIPIPLKFKMVFSPRCTEKFPAQLDPSAH
eukprot:1624607-Rhodomonas_salina.4